MKIVLLSGGKGKRLWPASTDDMPKQFMHIVENESMLKKTYNLISNIYDETNIYISTCDEYKKQVLNELNNSTKLILEPTGIGTFAAILNIAVYLTLAEKNESNTIVAVVPTDHDVDDAFYNVLETSKKHIKNASDICLIGIKPTYPATKFGYILKKDNYVDRFKEKPQLEEALNLYENDALWNSGIVVFKLGKVYEIAKKYCKFNTYNEFIKNYELLPHISFDKEVLEKEKNIALEISNSKWNDLGTWEVLAEKLSSSDEYNTNIINFEDKKIENNGVKDSIIVNSKNGVKLIPKNDNSIKFKKWGYYLVLNNFDTDNTHLKIKQLNIFPNKNISYQYHNHRKERWYILSGSGEVIIDGCINKIKTGDVIDVDIGKKHSVKADNLLQIIEIQTSTSKKIEEEDIVRIEEQWDKILKYITKGDTMDFNYITKNIDVKTYLKDEQDKCLIIYSITSIKNNNIELFKSNFDCYSTKEITKEKKDIDQKFINLDKYDKIISIGGGTAIDIGKYLSYKFNKSLIVIPTMLSTNAYATNKVALIIDNKVQSIDATLPTEIYFDTNLLQNSSKYNLYGFVDVFSISTALKDWEIANIYNNEEIEEEYYRTEKFLKEILEYIKEHKINNIKNDIEYIYDKIGKSGLITNRYGSGKPESGSEHIFAKSLEKEIKIPHAISVANGILLMTIAQSIVLKQELNLEVYDILKKLKIYDLNKKYDISYELIKRVFLNLKPRDDRFSVVNLIYKNDEIKNKVIEKYLRILKEK